MFQEMVNSHQLRSLSHVNYSGKLMDVYITVEIQTTDITYQKHFYVRPTLEFEIEETVYDKHCLSGFVQCL